MFSPHSSTRPANPAARGLCPAILAGLLAIGLAGCKEEKKTAPAAATTADAGLQKAKDAAQQNIQSTAAAPAKVQFRGVQVYAQANPQRIAVCGQTTPFADESNVFVPFVSLVTAQQKGDWTEYQFDQKIGASTADASRVYAAIVAYCYDNGGPPAGRGVIATPPLPDSVADPAKGGAASPAKPVSPTTAGKTPSPAPTEASGTVTMRQAANLRTDPKGSPIRVVPQGTSLKIFGQAPGGWLQVGETSPQGWVHESMLERR